MKNSPRLLERSNLSSHAIYPCGGHVLRRKHNQICYRPVLRSRAGNGVQRGEHDGKASQDPRASCSWALPIGESVGFNGQQWSGADRNYVHVEVALPALLFAPFCDLWVSDWYETESLWSIGGVCQLNGGQ